MDCWRFKFRFGVVRWWCAAWLRALSDVAPVQWEDSGTLVLGGSGLVWLGGGCLIGLVERADCGLAGSM